MRPVGTIARTAAVACFHERRQRGDRHRHVVLDAGALRALRLRHRFAQPPQRIALRERFGDRGVEHEPVAHGAFERRLEHRRAGRRPRASERSRRARSSRTAARAGRDTPGTCRAVNSTAILGRYSKLDTRRRSRPQPPEQLDCRGRTAHGDERRLDAARTRKELQARGRDHAERAFRADEQVVEVVAGVVLAQAREPVEHPPVGAARPRVRARDRAPRRSAARSGRRRWSRGCRRSGSCPRRRATAERSGRRRSAADCTSARMQPASTVIVKFGGVERADAVHAAQREHDLVAAGAGRRAAAVAGVAAVRHDADAELVADREHLRRSRRSRRAGRPAASRRGTGRGNRRGTARFDPAPSMQPAGPSARRMRSTAAVTVVRSWAWAPRWRVDRRRQAVRGAATFATRTEAATASDQHEDRRERVGEQAGREQQHEAEAEHHESRDELEDAALRLATACGRPWSG